MYTQMHTPTSRGSHQWIGIDTSCIRNYVATQKTKTEIHTNTSESAPKQTLCETFRTCLIWRAMENDMHRLRFHTSISITMSARRPPCPQILILRTCDRKNCSRDVNWCISFSVGPSRVCAAPIPNIKIGGEGGVTWRAYRVMCWTSSGAYHFPSPARLHLYLISM